MKNNLLIAALLLLVSSTYSQDSSINRLAYLLQYGQYIHPLMEAKHNSIYHGELKGFSGDFQIVSTFQIDTKGCVINLNIRNHTSNSKVKDYLSKLILSTNNGWLPQISKSKEVVSDTITCCFFFFIKDLSFEEKMKQAETEMEEAVSLQNPAAYKIAHEASAMLADKKKKSNVCFVFLKI